MSEELEKIRMLIVDDHTMFRESLSRLLAGELEAEVQHCSSVHEGISILHSWHADLVLLDFYLGSERGSTFLIQAQAGGFEGKALLLTAGVNDFEAANMIRQGVSGIVSKSRPATSSTHLHSGIRRHGCAHQFSRVHWF